MKANELRIGCTFQLKDSILGDGIATIKNKYHLDVAFDLLEYNSIKPIPLTKEWLVKFKFEELEKDCRTFFKKEKFKVELSNGGNVYYNRHKFISSVHQLQNLYFALTGEELTFKSE
jgi:hypothetical protein